MRVLRTVYRELLYVSKVYDASSGLRASMSLDMRRNDTIRSSGQKVGEIVTYNQHLSEFLRHRTYYLPILPSQSLLSSNQKHDEDEMSHRSISETIRTAFRKPWNSPHGIDSAFVALRSLNEQLQVAEQYGFHPTPTPSAKVLPEVSNVRHAATLGIGTFLLAHPLLNGIFSRSVILITQHSPEKGTRGLIVNLATSDSVARTFKVSLDVSSAFGSNSVFCGGPVAIRHAEFLHRNSDLGGVDVNAEEPNESSPIYWGGDLEVAARRSIKERGKANQVVFFKGVSVWIAGQLKNELRQGTWIPVVAPVSVALNAERRLWSMMMKSLGGEFEDWAYLPELE